MTDQLSLSIWLDRNSRGSRLKHFEKLLRVFPFSQRPQPQSTISVQAVNATEPPLLEQPLNGPIDAGEVISIVREWTGDDVACRVESWWDLWQFEEDWKLAPWRVVLSCIGPEFDDGSDPAVRQEDLRVDFGVDTWYLPQPELAGGAKLVESNIKSLLRLVHEIDSALPVEMRKLETESGENFAERLQRALVASRIQ